MFEKKSTTCYFLPWNIHFSSTLQVNFKATLNKGSWERWKGGTRGVCQNFSTPSCLAGSFLLGKPFILTPHVCHWPFVCNNVHPQSVWRFHTSLTIHRLSWKYTGWQWQRKYRGGKRKQERERSISPVIFCEPLLTGLCWLRELWPETFVPQGKNHCRSHTHKGEKLKHFFNHKGL